MQIYTFDVQTYVTIPVQAKSEREARALLTDAFGDYEANFGAWPNGDPILGNGGGFCDKPTLSDIEEPDYYLYGDYALESERLLWSGRGREAAREHWDDEVKNPGLFARIELISFSDSGEAETLWEWRRDED